MILYYSTSRKIIRKELINELLKLFMNSKKIKHKEIVMDEVTIQPFNKKK